MVGGVAAVAHHAGRQSAQLQDSQQQQAAQAAPEYDAAPPPPPAPAPAAAPTSSVAEQLTQLKGLLDAGALTQEEFDAEKQKVLAQG
jgi:hypothetical protein